MPPHLSRRLYQSPSAPIVPIPLVLSVRAQPFSLRKFHRPIAVRLRGDQTPRSSHRSTGLSDQPSATHRHNAVDRSTAKATLGPVTPALRSPSAPGLFDPNRSGRRQDNRQPIHPSLNTGCCPVSGTAGPLPCGLLTASACPPPGPATAPRLPAPNAQPLPSVRSEWPSHFRLSACGSGPVTCSVCPLAPVP